MDTKISFLLQGFLLVCEIRDWFDKENNYGTEFVFSICCLQWTANGNKLPKTHDYRKLQCLLRYCKMYILFSSIQCRSVFTRGSRWIGLGYLFNLLPKEANRKILTIPQEIQVFKKTLHSYIKLPLR